MMLGQPVKLSASLSKLAATGSSATVCTVAATEQLYIQKGVVVCSKASANAKVRLLNSTSGAVVWEQGVASGGWYPFDFGEVGYPLTKGKNLRIVEASATANSLYIKGTGYKK